MSSRKCLSEWVPVFLCNNESGVSITWDTTIDDALSVNAEFEFYLVSVSVLMTVKTTMTTPVTPMASVRMTVSIQQHCECNTVLVMKLVSIIINDSVTVESWIDPLWDCECKCDLCKPSECDFFLWLWVSHVSISIQNECAQWVS